MPDLEVLRDGLPAVAFILVAGYLGYVASIVVPFLRRAAEPPGDGSQFTWNFIVPCLDEAATVDNSVRRLLAQFPEAYVWCVDDASTDATPRILNRLAAEFERVHVVTRRLPNAREGKGLALNAGWAAMTMALPLGVDPRRIIVGVIDADGHLDPRCLDMVAGAACFGDPSVSAVQIKVRVVTDVVGPSSQRPTRFGRLLVRLQDSEFTGIIAAQQILRRRLGSVGLGGNGQFTRLTALNRIAEEYGAPWHRSLLEDFELPVGLPLRLGDRRLILVTSHRRESFGEGLRGICEAVRDLGDRFPDVVIAYPMHRNPAVRRQVGALLDDRASVVLLDDVDYLAMLWLMDRSSLVITDSGGLQEEAPSMGKPLIVVREKTERPEAVEAGCAFVVGTDRQAIVAGASRLLLSAKAYEAACPRSNPFGDGAAAARIVDVLSAQPGLSTPRRTAAEGLVRADADRVRPRRRTPDPLDRARTETSTRLAELRPLVDEHARLTAALQALGDADSHVNRN